MHGGCWRTRGDMWGRLGTPSDTWVQMGARGGVLGPMGTWGECLPGARPARARRATFVLTIPTSAPDLPSHGEAPQVDHVALHTFPTKHVAK